MQDRAEVFLLASIESLNLDSLGLDFLAVKP